MILSGATKMVQIEQISGRNGASAQYLNAYSSLRGLRQLEILASTDLFSAAC
jgi:hypothetical protein